MFMGALSYANDVTPPTEAAFGLGVGATIYYSSSSLLTSSSALSTTYNTSGYGAINLRTAKGLTVAPLIEFDRVQGNYEDIQTDSDEHTTQSYTRNMMNAGLRVMPQLGQRGPSELMGVVDCYIQRHRQEMTTETDDGRQLDTQDSLTGKLDFGVGIQRWLAADVALSVTTALGGVRWDEDEYDSEVYEQRLTIDSLSLELDPRSSLLIFLYW